MRKILLVAILIFTTIMISGCFGGLVSDEEYSTLISGITATKKNGETISYNLDILKDNIQFNNEIESADYCKLEIRNVKGCRVKSLCFFIRSSKDCILTFTLFTNNTELASVTMECASYIAEEIDFFLNETINLSTADNLYIKIEEIKGEDSANTTFVFDTLIIFFEENK